MASTIPERRQHFSSLFPARLRRRRRDSISVPADSRVFLLDSCTFPLDREDCAFDFLIDDPVDGHCSGQSRAVASDTSSRLLAFIARQRPSVAL